MLGAKCCCDAPHCTLEHRHRCAARDARRLAALLRPACPTRVGLLETAAPACRAFWRSAPWVPGLRGNFVTAGRSCRSELPERSPLSSSASPFGHAFGGQRFLSSSPEPREPSAACATSAGVAAPPEREHLPWGKFLLRDAPKVLLANRFGAPGRCLTLHAGVQAPVLRAGRACPTARLAAKPLRD